MVGTCGGYFKCSADWCPRLAPNSAARTWGTRLQAVGIDCAYFWRRSNRARLVDLYRKAQECIIRPTASWSAALQVDSPCRLIPHKSQRDSVVLKKTRHDVFRCSNFQDLSGISFEFLGS